MNPGDPAEPLPDLNLEELIGLTPDAAAEVKELRVSNKSGSERLSTGLHPE
jgi:hypothetical protein